jgi:1,4-alpha-glucan branching enzyme
MWLSEQTAWTWERLWPLERAFWDVAPAALENADARPVLAQATRELVLAQSSDWQFIISTGAVPDYAFRRFNEHCENAEQLVAALRPGQEAGLSAARARAEEIRQKDDLFPDPLPAVAAALAGTRTLAVS